MAKDYPLDVQNVGDDTYCVMSKGHHDSDVFMAKVREDGYDWPLGNPKHVWVKTTPCNTGEYQSHYNIVDEGTAGAWPATYSWEAYGEDQHKNTADQGGVATLVDYYNADPKHDNMDAQFKVQVDRDNT